MAMLEVNHLAIQFGGLRAVDGFNVSIEKGQLYGLIGPNGAGKTTIFNLLTGVYKPTEGIIKLDGQILKGALGISGTGALYKDVKHYFFPIGIILVLLTLFIVQNLVNSRSGRAIMATRDNRIAAESVGIDVTKFKLLAFTISAALAGVAGVLYAHNLSMLKVSGFDYNMSILILVYVVLGGIGNLRGSMIATIILYALPELLRGFANYRMLIYAIVLIVMMLFNWAPAARNWRARTMEKIRGTKNKKEAA